MPIATIRGHTIHWVDEHYPGFWAKTEAGLWEPHTYATLDRHVTAETTVLDLGAHIGAITLYAAQCAARVIAVEPDPVSRAALLRNLAANPATAGRVEVIAGAVSPTGGAMILGSAYAGGDSMSSTLVRHPITQWNVESITPARLAAMLPDAGPTFIKIDIEGGEYDFVPMAWPLWQRARTSVLVSTHPQILRAADPDAPIRQRTRAMFQALDGYGRVAVGGGATASIACVVEGAARGWGLKSIAARDWLFTPNPRA